LLIVKTFQSSIILPGCGDEKTEEEEALAVEEIRRRGLNFGGSLKGTENKNNETLLLRLNLSGPLKETENRDFVELQKTKKAFNKTLCIENFSFLENQNLIIELITDNS
jgi:hypothetical protein